MAKIIEQTFNFDSLLKESVASLIDSSSEEHNVMSYRQLFIKSNQYKSVKGIDIQIASQHMACIEDNMDLIYAFSYSHSKGSVVTFLILDKIANEQRQRQLIHLPTQITSMCLIIRKDSLFLVTGSCCGRLFTSCFNVDTATTKQIKLSEYKITSLVEFREYVCASDQSGRIYVIDCVELVVVAELWTTVIFSDTMKRKLFIDDKCLLLAQAYSQGYITIWDVNSIFAKIKVNPKQKKYFTKPKMHINECITDYIVWVDFFGIFIAVILESGELKIIAVSLTNQAEENYKIIAEINVFASSKYGLKAKEFLNITNALKHSSPQQSILVGFTSSNPGAHPPQIHQFKLGQDISFALTTVVLLLNDIDCMLELHMNNDWSRILIRNDTLVKLIHSRIFQ